jgi:hypothetical protein
MLFKYRLQLTGFELPERVRASQLEFDDWLAAILETMAERMEETGCRQVRDSLARGSACGRHIHLCKAAKSRFCMWMTRYSFTHVARPCSRDA